MTLSLELDGVQNVRSVLRLGNKYFPHGAALGAQKLQYGVAPFNLISTDPLALARGSATGAARSSSTRSRSSGALGTT
ncbi:MAG: hypothetical protein WCF25_10930 [Acidimicrobiales bacterium]